MFQYATTHRDAKLNNTYEQLTCDQQLMGPDLAVTAGAHPARHSAVQFFLG